MIKQVALEPIYLSRLQHYLYCSRQFALIELENIWIENQFTAEGQVLHQRVNQADQQKRGAVRTARALRLANAELRIEGVADVVEYHQQADGTEIPFPIEYKRGKPKAHRADEVQLCAQALCLEEMHGVAIPEGALFYGEVRRRHPVIFDAELRNLTLQTIIACRDIVQTNITPHAIYQARKCNGCSLIDQCHPKDFGKSASAWLAAQLKKD
ncbi:CRISPR-associated exonuclease, Cas4 family [Nitrosomonas ureae]|uniref:CRISPR-associated exonuclease Cas4 n=1 Tax=Nitrosomonas ureae TaxID=44577 RepID=A0A1H2G1R5_9PROT|nr:CRISPR-associated protein Cas4 [Nitrosomonas ureae]ALQ52126.1 CRISPR-associated protein Cas4 [Nitrosomonas ureae]SDU13521.1 CRISPR-associated exonuclease, Cas4 family [Nitrosomonas ureae]